MTMQHDPGTIARRVVRAAALVCVLCLPALTFAQSVGESVPATLRVAILLRALQYEKGFSGGSGSGKLVVLSGSKGVRDANEVGGPFKELGGNGAAGRNLSVETSSLDAAADEVRRHSAQIVYVAIGNEEALAELSSIRGVIVLCGGPASVGKGCLLSVESAGGTSRLVIDLGRAEKAGLKFDARMLRLARVIR